MLPPFISDAKDKHPTFILASYGAECYHHSFPTLKTNTQHLFLASYGAECCACVLGGGGGLTVGNKNKTSAHKSFFMFFFIFFGPVKNGKTGYLLVRQGHVGPVEKMS